MLNTLILVGAINMILFIFVILLLIFLWKKYKQYFQSNNNNTLFTDINNIDKQGQNDFEKQSNHENDFDKENKSYVME